jgi:peptidoglycan/xylan/chitin deacetylase (PgdA/CDA1 family)
LTQGWNFIRLTDNTGWTNTGTDNWTNTMTKLRFKFTGVDGGEWLTIDGISANVTYEHRVIFTFDDGYSNTYENAFPIMEQYGFKGTVYINPSSVDTGEGHITLNQCKELYNAGWDISSHGNAHIEYNSSTLEQIDDDVLIAKNWLFNNGFTRSYLHFGVPNGQDTTDLQTTLTKYGYLTSRNSIYDNFYPGQSYHNLALPSQPIKNINAIQYTENLVEQAKIQGKTCILMFHQIVENDNIGEYYWSTSKFTDLCKILYYKGSSVVTMSEWYNGL